MKIEVSKIGAEMQSFFSTKLNKELLWQGDSKHWARKAPVLFPIVGKLANNQFNYEGKTYELNQHGFARDMVFDILEQSTNSVSYILKSNSNSLLIYPFNFELVIIYTLIDHNLDIIYRVKNTDTHKMYFSVGGHPGFTCPVFDGETIEDYELEFEKTETPIHHMLINGLIDQQQMTDPVKHIHLSEKLFENDALIYSSLNSSYVDLKNSKNNYALRFHFNKMPYLAFWKKPEAPFICIEPWHGIADSVNSNQDFIKKTGIEHLLPYEVFETTYSISLL